jgi:hypothetical protein
VYPSIAQFPPSADMRAGYLFFYLFIYLFYFILFFSFSFIIQVTFSMPESSPGQAPRAVAESDVGNTYKHFIQGT